MTRNIVPTHVHGRILQSTQYGLQLMDNVLRCGQEEGHHEDEDIGNELLGDSPAPVGHVLPDDVPRRRSIPDSPLAGVHGQG